MSSMNDPHKGKKFCQHCQRWLPIDKFHKNKSKPDGLSSYCKEGMRKAVADSRKKNPYPKRGRW